MNDFEKWWGKNKCFAKTNDLGDPVNQGKLHNCWNHQQQKIEKIEADNLNTRKRAVDIIRRLYKKYQSELKKGARMRLQDLIILNEKCQQLEKEIGRLKAREKKLKDDSKYLAGRLSDCESRLLEQFNKLIDIEVRLENTQGDNKLLKVREKKLISDLKALKITYCFETSGLSEVIDQIIKELE